MQEIKQRIKNGLTDSTIINSALSILEKRLAGNEFLFSHSLRTALSLKEIGLDEQTITSGLLHHIPETFLTLKDVGPEKNEEILTIAKKANRLRRICSFHKTQKLKPIKKWQKIFLSQQAENLRRMAFVITQDLRPIFVCLACKLDEMKNLERFDESLKLKKSAEALEILSPLAYGVGMGEIKGQLEDLAFPHLYPKEYQWLMENVKEKYSERKKDLERIKPILKQSLKETEIKVLDIHARAKHYFSLYQKLLRHEMDIEKIYDLVALRVIVPDIEACYRALGAIHSNWRPLPGRIKDYISSPKPNGYRSLHTTVACHECGRNLEIQIKTKEMHQEAEFGAAAHLSYKGKLAPQIYQQQFYWLEQVRRWQSEAKDIRKIAEYLKSELFKDHIFVFTPMGDVINLPKGSCPVDFAYAVHSEIGDHCREAKVNGKIVPLKQTLKNGQTIEIITDKNKTPSSDWLRFVKTAKAKSKIRHFLETAYGMELTKAKKKSFLKKVSLIKKIIPSPLRKKGPQVLIGGESGISVKFSKCCSPKLGDEISGFVTKGEGASVHKVNCQNLKYLKEKWPQKIVLATWQFENKGKKR